MEKEFHEKDAENVQELSDDGEIERKPETLLK